MAEIEGMGHGHHIVEQTRSELVLKLQPDGSFQIQFACLDDEDFGQILICNTSATPIQRVLVAYSEMIDIFKIGIGRRRYFSRREH